MTQQKTFRESLKKFSWPTRIILICLLPGIVIHSVIYRFLPDEKKEDWKGHVTRNAVVITAMIILVLAAVISDSPSGTSNIKSDTIASENTENIASDDDDETKSKTDNNAEKELSEEEIKKAKEEEEKARLAEEEKAKKAAEEAEKQRQEEAALQEKKARASAAFANPLGHKGEIIAVTGTITVDYAYRKNDTKKYTTKLPAGTKDGWGGFWIDTQYGKCYAEYSGHGPKKDYNSGDTVTFVGEVVSDESTFEPMNGIVAPLWINATEDF